MRQALKKHLIDAGCASEKAVRCAAIIERAVAESVELHKRNPDKPNGAGTVRGLEKLRKALVDLDASHEGRTARAILNTQPSWRGLSIEELDHAIRVAKTGKRRGPNGSRSPALDLLLRQLHVAAAFAGFTWRAHKGRSTGAAEGNLPKFLRQLELDFIPESDSTLLKYIDRARAGLHPKNSSRKNVISGL